MPSIGSKMITVGVSDEVFQEARGALPRLSRVLACVAPVGPPGAPRAPDGHVLCPGTFAVDREGRRLKANGSET